MDATVELILGVLVGFAFGYGVREYISQRRHAAAREHFKSHAPSTKIAALLEAQQRVRSQQEHIDRLKRNATAGRPLDE
jgi:hypothetical protein